MQGISGSKEAANELFGGKFEIEKEVFRSA